MKRVAIGTVALLLLVATQPALGQGISQQDPMDHIKQYLNRMVAEVKETDDPAEKRAVLDRSLQKMERAINQVKEMPGIELEDREHLDALQANIADKRAQLNGENDYERIADAQLDRYADYVQQDLEQAQRLVVSIGLTTLLLLVILLLLI